MSDHSINHMRIDEKFKLVEELKSVISGYPLDEFQDGLRKIEKAMDKILPKQQKSLNLLKFVHIMGRDELPKNLVSDETDDETDGKTDEKTEVKTDGKSDDKVDVESEDEMRPDES